MPRNLWPFIVATGPLIVAILYVTLEAGRVDGRVTSLENAVSDLVDNHAMVAPALAKIVEDVGFLRGALSSHDTAPHDHINRGER